MMFGKDPANPGDAVTTKLRHGFHTFEIVFLTLALLSIIGVAVTDFSRKYSHWYWYAMVPVFACCCLIMEWTRAGRNGKSWTLILRTQLLTWFGLLVSIHLVYSLLSTGRLDYENTGLVMLLLVALTTFFAGINLDYRLCLLGGALAVSLLIVAYLEEYVWVLLLMGILAVAVIVHFLRKRS
jgi:hypothetical protein